MSSSLVNSSSKPLTRSIGVNFVPKQVSFCQQFRALLFRNCLIKYRQKVILFTELFFPIWMILLIFLLPHTRHDFVARNKPTFETTIFTRNASIEQIRLYMSTWYIINNVTLDNEQMERFLTFVRQSSQTVCLPQLCGKKIDFVILDDQQFQKFYMENKDQVNLAIILQSMNSSAVKYSIRLPFDNVPNDKTMTQSMTKCIDFNSRKCDSFKYYTSGFSLVQTIMDNAILNFKSVKNSSFLMPNMKISTFPLAKQEDCTELRNFIPNVPASFLVVFITSAVLIVKEKEKRIKDSLFMMGLGQIVYWLSWFVVQGLFTVTTCVFWTVALLCFDMVRINPILLYFFLQVSALSFILMAFFISTFFSKTKVVSIGATIFGVLFLFIPSTAIYFSISKTVLGFLFFISTIPFVTTLNSIISTNHDYSFGVSILIIFVDCFLYWGLILFFDNLISNNVSFFKIKQNPPSNEYELGKQNHSDVEPIGEDLQSMKAIKIENLVKKFNSKVAVNCVTLDLYESQITSFLGANGAGKTTLINMLTGQMTPTSGQVSIFGLNVQNASDLKKLRTSFGVCLQDDILFDELTPIEHLRFFAQIKGLQGNELEEEVNYMIKLMDLELQTKTRAEKLSGGQKRKLCISIALIGKSKIVFLDEPTSGVDPYSRQKIWSVLQSLKNDRIIILTTHFMDEADILSDRKAFIFDGKILCVGSSLFVKNKYGVGYHLRIDIASKDTEHFIRELVTNKIHSAKFDRLTNNEMLFTLPKRETGNFSELFDSLDLSIQRKDLGIKAYGITMTTLEDVFFNICQKGEHTNDIENSVQVNENFLEEMKSVRYNSNFILKFLIFTKIRILILTRNQTFFGNLVLQLIYPLVFGIILSFQLKPTIPSPFTLSSKVYKQNTILYKLNSHSNATIDNFPKCWKWIAVADFNFEAMKDYIYAIDFANDTNLVDEIIIQANYSHSLPILQNAISNIFASRWLNRPLLIEIANYPFPEDLYSLSKLSYLLLYVFMLSPALCTLTVNFALEVVEDRQALIKSYLHSCGLRILEYWCPMMLVYGTFICIIYCIVAIFSIVIIPIPFLICNWQSSFCFFLIFILNGPITLLMCYVLSFIFSTKEVAQSVLIQLILLPTLIVAAGFIYLQIKEKTFVWILCFIWPFSIPIVAFFSLFMIYAKNQNPNSVSYFDWNKNLSPCIVSLILNMLLYSILLYLIESKKFDWRKKKTYDIQSETSNLDIDVREEKSRVDKIFENVTQIDSVPLLLLKDLTKVFNDKVAVNSLSLTVESGQIFGLLGTNGAGKTTTMRILIGDEDKTSGNVLIDRNDIDSQIDHSKIMSYCPQNNPLWDDITLLEHLQLFCAIRGVPKEKMESFSQLLLQIFDIEKHANQNSNTLSGGTKRKLCLLIAIVGNAKLTLLDEPSTGMDPKSKRFMWNIVISNFEPNGPKSAILTTHSMEEVNALCTKMAIMVRGTLQCLGTIQHLTNKYGTGYILEVQLKQKCQLKQDDIHKLARELFPNVNMTMMLNNHFIMEVPQSDIHSLGFVFKTLQTWLQTYSEIEEYSFCQSSIERVFIGFAEKNGN